MKHVWNCQPVPFGCQSRICFIWGQVLSVRCSAKETCQGLSWAWLPPVDVWSLLESCRNHWSSMIFPLKHGGFFFRSHLWLRVSSEISRRFHASARRFQTCRQLKFGIGKVLEHMGFFCWRRWGESHRNWGNCQHDGDLLFPWLVRVKHVPSGYVLT